MIYAIFRVFKRLRPALAVAGGLLGTSLVFYLIYYLVFPDVTSIIVSLLANLAFLPVSVLIVAMVIERVISRREKHILLQKLNMVIGAFFSEVGTELLGKLLNCFENPDGVCLNFGIGQGWTHQDFRKAETAARRLESAIDARRIDLAGLKEFLMKKQDFILGLLENPNLLEHEEFTDLLWAISHLAEELEARPSFEGLPDSDLDHLAGDIQRVYRILAAEWLAYVEHLKLHYPYLFSLVLRTHPFQPHPSPVVLQKK